MSVGSREGGGRNILEFMPANQNVRRSDTEQADLTEGQVLSLGKKREVLARKKEMEAQSLEELAEKALKMSCEIKNYDKKRHNIIIEELDDLHADRIEFLFKDIWCDLDKIAKDPTYAKAIMSIFSFKFSKYNK